MPPFSQRLAIIEIHIRISLHPLDFLLIGDKELFPISPTDIKMLLKESSYQVSITIYFSIPLMAYY